MMLALVLGLLTAFDHEGCEPVLVATVADELRVEGLEPAQGQLQLRCGAREVEVRVRVGDEVTRVLTLGDDARREVRLAVQVADLYRAQVAEARFRRAVVTPMVEGPVPMERAVPSPWHATVGVGLMGAPGGFHLEPAVSGEVLRQVPGVALGVRVQTTVRATAVRSAQWSASTGLAQASAAIERPIELGAWVLEPRLTLGALIVWSVGQASADFIGSTGVTATLLGSVGSSAWRRVSDQVAVGLEADLAVAPISVRVEVPGSTMTIGLIVSAGAAVRFQ